MSTRTFSLEQAQKLLPVLESLLRTAITGKKLIEEVDGEMQDVVLARLERVVPLLTASPAQAHSPTSLRRRATSCPFGPGLLQGGTGYAQGAGRP